MNINTNVAGWLRLLMFAAGSTTYGAVDYDRVQMSLRGSCGVQYELWEQFCYLP